MLVFVALSFVLFGAGLASSTNTSISVLNPIDAQLPLVAHVNSSYSWSFSSKTFITIPTGSFLNYSTSHLPAWLAFDASTRTLSGTPEPGDEGSPHITVTAQDPYGNTASNKFNILVTDAPEPAVTLPIATQFYAANPSLSSVFLLGSNSALGESNPALRVPPQWSFSIGFQGDTFNSSDDLSYEVLLADGTALPEWAKFDVSSITLNGVTPRVNESLFETVPMALFASNQDGFSMATLPFDLIVALHELSYDATLPTMNVTVENAFNITFNSPADFIGVLVDNATIQPSNISELSIDTSQYSSWLSYDPGSMTLSGTPPSVLADNGAADPVLPVVLTSTFNQSIKTSVSLAVVPSYFTTQTLNPILAEPGSQINFDLSRYFSNSTRDQDVNLTATFDPSSAMSYLTFDTSNAFLSGTVPGDPENYTHVSVSFVAYSRVTHSTSHASVIISLSSSDYRKPRNSNSTLNRSKLALGLGAGFGVVGGLFSMIGIFAICRKYCSAEDTALDMYDYEKKGPLVLDLDRGYGWTEKIGPELDIKSVLDVITPGTTRSPTFSVPLHGSLAASPPANANNLHPYGSLTLSPHQRTRMVKKGQFFKDLKTTIRTASGKYKRKITPSVISPPMLIVTKGSQASIPGLEGTGSPFGPNSNSALAGSVGSLGPFGRLELNETSFTLGGSSPSSSFGNGSIPQRRPDFGPPRKSSTDKDKQSHVRGDSDDSGSSSLDSAAHAEEAVIRTAARTASIHSANSASMQGRPRLVQFTSAARVPVPRMPSAAQASTARGRTVSHSAKVVTNEVDGDGDGDVNLAIDYARSLEDNADVRTTSSHSGSHTYPSPNPSFFSVASASHSPHAVTRVLVRAGEHFSFRFPLPSSSSPSSLTSSKRRNLVAAQITGAPLPAFVQAKFGSREVEFGGVAGKEDEGEMHVGLYGEGGECVGRLVIEVC